MKRAFVVAKKDLMIEWRSRMLLVRVAPFALLVLVLFAWRSTASRSSCARRPVWCG